MAVEKFKSGTIRMVDPMGTKSVLNIWGIETEDVLDDLRDFFDEATSQAVTVAKSYGKIVTMQDPDADEKIKAMKVPAGASMTTGSLILKRDGVNPVYAKGVFPASIDEVIKIQKKLVEGTKSINSVPINEVIPDINLGFSVKKK